MAENLSCRRSEMKAGAVLALVLLLCRSGLQDAETPGAKFDVNQEIVRLHERAAKLKEDLRVMDKNNAGFRTRLVAANLDLKNLNEPPQIAFSAALTHPVGPYNVDLTLVYDKVITDVGRAYNSVTGFFTAPLNGAYYIRFTSCDNTESHGMAVDLYKNNEKMNALAKYSNGFMEYFSSGLVLQLEAGDLVYTKLPANTKLYGSADYGTTFSGFLLFPM